MSRNSLSLFVSGLVFSALLGGPAIAQDGVTENATLVVRIQNVAAEGTVRLGLYSRDFYPDDNATPVASADVSAVGGETVITLQKVPVGTYAIEVYQDINNNGKMDWTPLGMPKEPYGFSRDARPFLSKPDFSRVKFEVAPGQNAQSLHLQNTTAFVASN